MLADAVPWTSPPRGKPLRRARSRAILRRVIRTSLPRSASTLFAASRLALGALLAFALLAGCGSSQKKGPRVVQTDEKSAAAASAKGEWQEAADRWYSIHLAEGGKRARPALEAARALFELKDYESAGNLAKAMLQRFPKDPDLLTLNGRILMASNYGRAAQSYLERSLKERPDHAETLLLLGQLRIELGLEAAAVEPLEAYARLTGGDYASTALLARAHAGAGAGEAAYLTWRRAFELGQPGVEDLLAAAATCIDKGVRATHPEAAESCRQWLERAIQADPNCTSAHFQLGVLSEDTGAYDAAVAHYRAAVASDPSCLGAITNLAILHAGRGSMVEAREMVQRALELEKDEARRKALLKLVEPRAPDAEQP
ncbi:MAG: Tetratricopeptide repeat [Planctomycetota bacterium]|jgi:tetratricopeptide (TPR) repeat protein